MSAKNTAVALLILFILYPTCTGAEELRWTTRYWCTDENLEKKPGEKDELEIRKKEVLKDFRKVHPKAGVYEVRPVKRQWESLIYYCVSYKGINDFEGVRKHYYQDGRGRFSKEEWVEILRLPPRW